MTAFIIGLIAALGIGGGIAVANHGGGSGGGSAIVEPAGTKYSALEEVLDQTHATDSPSAVFDSTLQVQIQTPAAAYVDQSEKNGWLEPAVAHSAKAARSMRRAPSSQFDFDHSIYDRPENDMVGDMLVGEWPDNGSPIVALKLIAGEGFAIGSVDADYKNWKELFTISKDNKESETSLSYVYQNQGELDGSILKSQIQLGAPVVGLTTADFGMWSYSRGGDEGSQNFFIFDDRFSYVNGFRNDNVNMEGVAFVQSGSLLGDSILTGNIALHLDLAKNTLTGSITVPENTRLNLSGIEGSINGSIVSFNGLGTPAGGLKLPTKPGEMRGGIGKLLVGTDRLLEMVGNLGPQLELPSWEQFKNGMSGHGIPNDLEQQYEDDLKQQYDKDFPTFIADFVTEHGNEEGFWSALREVYEQGKADYTFGAKEVR